VKESEWNAFVDPDFLLTEVRGKVRDRKLLLFGAACCKLVTELLDREWTRNYGILAESIAEQSFTAEQKERADLLFLDATPMRIRNRERMAVWYATKNAAKSSASAFATRKSRDRNRKDSADWTAHRKLQADVARDVFGPVSFRTLKIDPRWLAWNGGTVVELARVTYQERVLSDGRLDVSRLGKLADALAEAGCTDTEILGHLRQQGKVHVRGCHVIDLLLTCDCRGFERWGHCKHHDGLQILADTGRLPRLYTARDARHDPDLAEPPQLN
jgi:hypothetical protein